MQLAMASQERLSRTAEWLSKLRRIIERFILCYSMCDNKQESIFAIIDILDHTLGMMSDSARFLRRVSGIVPPILILTLTLLTFHVRR